VAANPNRFWAVVEYRDARLPTLKPVTLSPATVANGTSYQGVAVLSAAVWRWRWSDGSSYWSEFKGNGEFTVRITLKNGDWEIEELNASDLGRRPEALGQDWVRFDTAEYLRGNLTCEIAAKEPHRPEPGYVCPGTILFGPAGAGDLTVKNARKIKVIKNDGQIATVRLDDGQEERPGDVAFRMHSKDIRKSLPCK